LFVVPPVVPWGNSFARVRISSNGTSSPMGLAPNGEVEDYKIRLAALDFGDAPEDGTSYATTLARNGARHLQNGLLWMSPSVDAEFDGQPSAGADGDDLNGTDDEDGVTLPTFIRQDDSAAVTVNATAPCRLNAWVDFNADGDWLDAGEQIFADAALAAGANTLGFSVPLAAQIGTAYARFRVSSAGGDGPAGQADDGEVEDYTLEVREKFPPALGLKWRQPPDCPFGLNLQSWSAPHPQGGGVRVGPVVADDWWCDGRPINAIRWWGSYILYGGPTNDLQVQRPNGFRLSWYLDRPTNALDGAFSRPGPLLKQTTVTLAPYRQRLENLDEATESYVCTVPLDFLGPTFEGAAEHKFEYNVVLGDPWMEKNTLERSGYAPPCSSNVYWLSIEALYDDPPPEETYPWGWETTAQRFNWNDDAVTATNTLAGLTPWNDLTYIPNVWPWQGATSHPYLGKSVNMAFALLSEVVGRRATKWSQLPNMELGTDMPSWRYINPLMQPVPWATQALRADDFVSDGRRITDIHWWGSYLGWQSQYWRDEFDPMPAPMDVYERPLGFDLSWHLHDVAENAPGVLITNVFIPMERCHEMYYCTIPQPGHPYYLYGGHYWLNIQAVFDNSFVPSPPGPVGPEFLHEGWGWKIAGIEEGIRLARSVVSNYVPPSVSWESSLLPAWHPRAGTLHDLSFELTTDQPQRDAVIRITSIQRATNALVQVTSTGTGWAGTQYLQRRSTLVGTPVWVNVETNEAPFPPPYENIWLRAGSPVSNEFYRVLERNPAP
jgi:hypothetical protein